MRFDSRRLSGPNTTPECTSGPHSNGHEVSTDALACPDRVAGDVR